MHQITHIRIPPTGSAMWPKPTMNFSSYLPINEAHDLVTVNYTVTLRKVVVHEAYIQIGRGSRILGVGYGHFGESLGRARRKTESGIHR